MGMTPSTTQLRYWIACCIGRGGLAPLEPDEVDYLARVLGQRRHTAGQTIFSKGDEARLHVVRSGAVELTATIRGRRLVLQVLRSGAVFGDIPLLLHQPERLDARAVTDCVVLSADAATVMALVAQRPRFAQRWLVSLAERAAGFQERLVDLLSGPLDARVASLLLHQGERGDVRLSQARLANLVGAGRPAVNQTLKAFEAAGLVHLGYRMVRILDREGLQAIVEG
ncbi:HTH-type transcriptional regulator Cmr [soil metagenome]